MITEKKKGVLSFLSRRKHYIVSCNICKQDEGSGFTTDIGTYAFCLGNLRPYCNSCFSNGLEHYRDGEQLTTGSEYDCVICGKELPHGNLIDINQNVKHACFSCHHKYRYPDSLHSFGSVSMFCDWDSCYKCGALRVKDKNNNLTYYAIGAGKLNTTPLCKAISKAISTDKYACSHKYILAMDYTINKSDVKKITDEHLRELNDALSIPGHEEMIKMDRSDLAYSSCGFKLMWCEKCGGIDKELPDWWHDTCSA